MLFFTRNLYKQIQRNQCFGLKFWSLVKTKHFIADDVKKQLIAELEESKTNNSEVKRLESILSSLEQEMANTTEQLLQTKSQLEQEQAITKSLTKRTEVCEINL